VPPKVLTTWRTGQGAPGEWRVVEDASASQGKAIEQASADPTDYRFPLAVYQPLSAQDVGASVRFKAAAGRVDRAGGLAVRLLEADNYCVVRQRPGGQREPLPRGQGKAAADRRGLGQSVLGCWHTLALRAEGERFSVSFDGKPLLTHIDRTFPGPGKVALWTKADSIIRFDQLRIRPLR